jgi:hypothetical protein
MPENIRIGAFVLGGIFLLIAILGGNFKIFGAEIASTVSNRSLRFVAFILGTTLLIVTIFPSPPGSIPGSKPSEIPTSQTSPSPSQTSPSPSQTSPSPSQTSPSPSQTSPLLPPPSSLSSERILSNLKAVNINYSVTKSTIIEWLSDSDHRYLNVAQECLQVLQNQRLKGEGADLDKIYYYYLQILGVEELQQNPKIDQEKLKESLRKAYNNKNGADNQSFNEILS